MSEKEKTEQNIARVSFQVPEDVKKSAEEQAQTLGYLSLARFCVKITHSLHRMRQKEAQIVQFQHIMRKLSIEEVERLASEPLEEPK